MTEPEIENQLRQILRRLDFLERSAAYCILFAIAILLIEGCHG